MTEPLNLVFLGPPGAGKGTQAVVCARRLEIPHISTGDLFRQHLKDETPVGLMAKGLMDRGLLVPDDVVCQMVRDRLEHEDAERGFILDGFPRTTAQAETLEGDLKRQQRKLSAVISFDLQDEILVERLGGRITCKGCGAVFHKAFRTPAVEGTCDECQSRELYVREDDREEAVKARLVEYRDKTAPLLRYYGDRSQLVTVDAGQTIEAVQAALEKVLEGR